MAMKLQLTNRTKVLAGVVVLAGAGAAAWFLYLEEWLAGPPPVAASAPKPPAPTAAKAPAANPVPAAAIAAAEPAKPLVVEPPKPAPVEMPKKAPVPVAEVKPAPVPSPAPDEKPASTPARVAAPPSVPQVRASTPGPKYNDLMTAVIYRDAAAVSELIAFGKWLDKPDSQGLTPLMAAAILGDTTNAAALLKAGANPDGAVRIARERRDSAMTALLERYATSKRP